MDLLHQMLQKHPKNRPTSESALRHPAFSSVMSKSPLVVKNLFDPNEIIEYTLLTDEWAE